MEEEVEAFGFSFHRAYYFRNGHLNRKCDLDLVDRV